jgi:hypothetical protein
LSKFLVFINLIFIRSHTEFQKNQTMGLSQINKQGSIGIKINPMLNPKAKAKA